MQTKQKCCQTVTNVCASGHYQDSCGSKTAREMSTAVPLMWQQSYSAALGLPSKVYYSGLHAGVQFIKPHSHSLQHISHSSLQNSFWREAAAAFPPSLDVDAIVCGIRTPLVPPELRLHLFTFEGKGEKKQHHSQVIPTSPCVWHRRKG